MTQIKEKIEKWVKETLQTDKVVIIHPKELKNGDYSFFAAAELGAKASHAGSLAAVLNENKIPEIERVEAAGNFVNFYLSAEFFYKSVKEINESGENYGKTDLFGGQKAIVEYTDPNIMKPFHIGHLMSNTIGESISRIYEWNGADVIRANYYSDSGLSIAKAVWGIREKAREMPDGNSSLSQKAEFLGKCYAYGVVKYEEDENAALEIRDINKKIFDRSDKDINKIYDLGKKWSIENFEKLYEKLGSKFDWFAAESEMAETGKKTVLEFLDKGLFEESEEAVVFRGEKYNPKLHTRVFINKDGLPTYESKEIELTKKKFEKYDPNQSLIITANEQNEYFKVVLEALNRIRPDEAKKTKHISHGILRLPTGKMSSRTGDIITAESLIEQVKEKVLEKINSAAMPAEAKEISRNFSEEEKRNIAEIVSIGAIKYSILRQAIGGDIIFDFEKSISFEGDSGPYLQYTAVRANSVLEKAKSEIKNWDLSREAQFDGAKWETTELERYLYRFPEIVERAGKEYAPHYVVTYLTELAGLFNGFYANQRIIAENDPSSSYKIALTAAIFHVLKSGLRLLGIKVPPKM